MLKIYLLISIITSMSFAQKMTLDVRDYFTKKRIEFDSINFYNAGLGINKTLSSSTFINVEDLFIPTDVKNVDNVQVTLINNQLNINSSERILSVCLFDILGREILKEDVNNLQYHKSISSEFNSLFYLICIKTENGIYNSKLVNTNYQNFLIPNVMPASDKWIITVYKYSYNDKVIATDTLPDSLQIKLERIPLKVTINSTFKPCTKSTTELYFDGSNLSTITNDEVLEEGITEIFDFNVFTKESSIETWENYDYTCFGGGGHIYAISIAIEEIKDKIFLNFYFMDNNSMGSASEDGRMYFDINDYNYMFSKLYKNKESSITFNLSLHIGSYEHSYTYYVDGHALGNSFSGTSPYLTGTITFEIVK